MEYPRLCPLGLRNQRHSCAYSPLTQKRPALLLIRAFLRNMNAALRLRQRQVGALSMRHLSRHTDALTQRRVRLNRVAGVDGVGAHFDGQSRYADSTFYFAHGIATQQSEVGA